MKILNRFFSKNETNHYPDFWNDYALKFEAKLPNELNEVVFVVLDTETTGLDYEKDRILSIGALRLQNGIIEVNECFEYYLDQYYYHPENVEIHGILRDSGKDMITEIQAIQLFLDFLGNSVIVAHHSGFDITMLNLALERHGLPNLLNKVLDTSTLYKKTLIKSPLLVRKEHYSLDELADKFMIAAEDRHTALGDAYITAIAFLKILEKLKKRKKFSVKKFLK